MLIRNATLQMSATERTCMDVRVMNGCVWEMGAALVKGLYESETDLHGDVLMPGRMLETPISAADEKGGEHTEYGCQQKREEQRRETPQQRLQGCLVTAGDARHQLSVVHALPPPCGFFCMIHYFTRNPTEKQHKKQDRRRRSCFLSHNYSVTKGSRAI